MGCTLMPTPPSLITVSQFSPSSVDLIIPRWLVATIIPFDSTNFITQPPLWTCFQVFPLTGDLKRPLSRPMKTVPVEDSKTVRTSCSWELAYMAAHFILLFLSGKISFFQKGALEFGILW